MSKNFATFIFVNPFTLAAEVIWGLRNLSRKWQHMKLRNNFQPALPCCLPMDRQDHFYDKIKGRSFNTSCC